MLLNGDLSFFLFCMCMLDVVVASVFCFIVLVSAGCGDAPDPGLGGGYPGLGLPCVVCFITQ